MVERQLVGRLRGAGAVAAGAIALVLVIQVGLLSFLAMTSGPAANSLNDSGLRRTYTWRVLYDAATHDERAQERDAAKLLSLQSAFDDVGPEQHSLLQSFLAHPTAAAAQELFDTFDQATQQYESGLRTWRQRYRLVAIASGVVALAILGMLYLLMIRPIERRWEALIDQVDERRERFAAIFVESPDPMAIYRPDGTIVRGNAAAVRMLGFGEETRGAHWSLHVADFDRSMSGHAFERALQGDTSEFETQFRTASGTLMPVLCSLTPIRVRGKIVGVVGIAKDLSDIRASELELERSRERFASMFDFHPDAIAVIDAAGRITRANVQLEVLSQYRVEELIGMPVEMLATAQDAIERSGLAGQLYADHPIRLDAALRTRNGTSVVVRVQTVPMRAGGVLEGTYVVARDVTKERELEFRERQQRERLRSLAHIASEHAGLVERQINEPLAFAAHSLELDGGMVTRVRDDEVSVMYSVGIAHPVGTIVPFAESFTRHVFGTSKVLEFTEAQRADWASDPAQAREHWSAAIVTTAYADGVPVGGVVFYSRRTRGKPFADADRDFVRVVASMVGASLARERREEELEAIAYADPLTRLPNRRYALEHLAGAIARAERSDLRVIVCAIAVDGNEDDVVLAATRLQTVVNEGDVLARSGNSEFLVVQTLDARERGEFDLATRLREAVPGAGIGILIAPRDARTAETAAEAASRAAEQARV